MFFKDRRKKKMIERMMYLSTRFPKSVEQLTQMCWNEFQMEFGTGAHEKLSSEQALEVVYIYFSQYSDDYLSNYEQACKEMEKRGEL